MAIVAALADAAVTPKELLLVVALVAVVGSRSRGLRTESQLSNTVVATET